MRQKRIVNQSVLAPGCSRASASARFVESYINYIAYYLNLSIGSVFIGTFSFKFQAELTEYRPDAFTIAHKGKAHKS